MNNTPSKGQVRTIVFKEDGTWYGVALEFNIVVEGDDYDVVSFNLQEAIRGYVNAQKKIKGSRRFEPLNQVSDKEYEQLWQRAVSSKPIPSPIQLKHFGVTTV